MQLLLVVVVLLVVLGVVVVVLKEGRSLGSERRKEGRKGPPAGLGWVDKGAARARAWCAGSCVAFARRWVDGREG